MSIAFGITQVGRDQDRRNIGGRHIKLSEEPIQEHLWRVNACGWEGACMNMWVDAIWRDNSSGHVSRVGLMSIVTQARWVGGGIWGAHKWAPYGEKVRRCVALIHAYHRQLMTLMTFTLIFPVLVGVDCWIRSNENSGLELENHGRVALVQVEHSRNQNEGRFCL